MDPRIQQLQQYIKENLHQPLSRVQLAEEACLSPVHFDRCFKVATGLTPALYIEIHKVKEGLELLKEGMQVQEVAYQLGFLNYETFSRAFKKHCKIAPADLQILLRLLREKTNPDNPLLLPYSPNVQDLQSLVDEAMSRGVFRQDQLSELQVCLLRPKKAGFRTRKAEGKYQLMFEPALATKLRETMQV